MSEEKKCVGLHSCGKTLPLSEFNIIPRSGNPMGKCKLCVTAMKEKKKLNDIIAKRNESVDQKKELPTHLKYLRVAWR